MGFVTSDIVGKNVIAVQDIPVFSSPNPNVHKNVPLYIAKQGQLIGLLDRVIVPSQLTMGKLYFAFRTNDGFDYFTLYTDGLIQYSIVPVPTTNNPQGAPTGSPNVNGVPKPKTTIQQGTPTKSGLTNQTKIIIAVAAFVVVMGSILYFTFKPKSKKS